jgi:hypothetical protein
MTLEEIFVNKIEKRLLNFKRNPCSYQFRCPYCQTGSHHRSGRPWKNADFKAYFYQKKNAINFKCHKCRKYSQFHEFATDHPATDFMEYVREKQLLRNTGLQTNYPALDKAILDTATIQVEKLYLSSMGDPSNSQYANSEPSEAPQKSSSSESCGNAPKVQKLPPMRSPQQQAGHQANLNRLMNEKRERDRQCRGELW